MAIKTNLLYDILLVPNLGVEVPIGNSWSVAANCLYGWWSHNRVHDYWRIYGAEVEGRYWIGNRADYKQLSGHHIGVYAQAMTYDFEFGGRGYMGGKPGCSIWQKASFGAGINYGYSYNITGNWSLDFTVGIGYFGGDCQSYHPDNGCYVYDYTKHVNYIGPTRAEITLVWLLNFKSKKKGGNL